MKDLEKSIKEIKFIIKDSKLKVKEVDPLKIDIETMFSNWVFYELTLETFNLLKDSLGGKRDCNKKTMDAIFNVELH